MKKQLFKLPKDIPFDITHIFECGQCFRWNLRKDGSYIGVVRQNVLKIRQEEKQIIVQSMGNEKIDELCVNYFDLNRDYQLIQKQLEKVDKYLETSIQYGKGIRILHQDLWETIISFIISANNNIPRIKGIIEKLSKTYGNKIKWDQEEYYTFPTIEQLSKAGVKELRSLGLGFRDKRVYQTTQMFLNSEITLEELQQEKDSNRIREKLMTLPGVGRKVADCILLFGLNHFEVFPVDVWINRIMNELYLHEEDERKINQITIQKLANEKYQELAGIAQQYLYYWKREESKSA